MHLLKDYRKTTEMVRRYDEKRGRTHNDERAAIDSRKETREPKQDTPFYRHSTKKYE